MNDREFLEYYANLDTCDGICDEYPPYHKCPECEARGALNEIGEIIRTAVQCIKLKFN